MEGRCVEQDIILYVGQLELAIVPVEGWIIGPESIRSTSYDVICDKCSFGKYSIFL